MDGMASGALSLTEMPSPQFVMSAEGHRIATYSWGEDAAPAVLCVHGFASSCRDNWVATGWVRDLTRAGFRVVGVDQRGHGASDKPHDPHDYTMDALVGDLLTVLDTYLLDEVRYVGYSLGGRVGWQLLVEAPDRVTRGILGGIPDGRPLARLRIEQARAYVEHGIPLDDPVTQSYVTLAERVRGNDLGVLVSLIEGMRSGTSIRIPRTRRSSPCCSRPAARTRSSNDRASWQPRLRTASSSRSPAGITSTRRGRGCSARRRSPTSPGTDPFARAQHPHRTDQPVRAHPRHVGRARDRERQGDVVECLVVAAGDEAVVERARHAHGHLVASGADVVGDVDDRMRRVEAARPAAVHDHRAEAAVRRPEIEQRPARPRPRPASSSNVAEYSPTPDTSGPTSGSSFQDASAVLADRETR